MRTTTMIGIDGSDPLGFFAALGLLNVLDRRSGAAEDGRPRLAWSEVGYWRPVMHGVEGVEQAAEAVMSELETWKTEPALELAYVKTGGGGEGRFAEGDEKGAIRDLKPPPAVQAEIYREAAARAADGDRRTADTLAAFGTEVATDNNGYIKPTALHFTAGQQQFLAMARDLRAGVTHADFVHALSEPWSFSSKLPSFSWSGRGQRLYAFRGDDPSSQKRGSCPGAEWLALLGLRFLTCVPRGTFSGPVTRTSGVMGGWKSSVFTWPLWTSAASSLAVGSLLREPHLDKLSPRARAARGIAVVLSADILRSDQGGYGSFSPPRVR